ncbi:hypothetical protein D9M72_645740 [compost metagenome]
MADIDGVEAHQRREHPPVGFGDRAAGQVAPARQPLFQLVEHVEQRGNALLVGFLARGEAGLVDAVVDSAVDASVEFVDFGAQVLRIEIRIRTGQLVKGRIEHADDLGGFV